MAGRVHVGEHVHCRLLHVRISVGRRVPSWSLSRPQPHWIVPALNTRAPLAARYSVRWWVVVPGLTVLPKSCRSWRHRAGRRGQVDQAGRPEAVVDVLVGLVADGVRRQRRSMLPGIDAEAGVAPQPHLALGRRHREGQVCRCWPCTCVPVSPFSGLLPPGAAENRGSRHVAVDLAGRVRGALSQVSL